MVKVDCKSSSGKAKGSVELDDEIFGIEPNVSVMHQVVNAQLAARRAGTHKTKTRSEVRGGGSKPWKQKGTGRARAGSSRSPIWIGGGKAHGRVPRNYVERTNKKMKRLALRSSLSDRAAENKVVVVDKWDFSEPSTKVAKESLEALKVAGSVLVVLTRDDTAAALSFRNLPNVQILSSGQLNTHDILVNDFVIFTQETLPSQKSGDES